MRKFSYKTQLTFDITDGEKRQAMMAKRAFQKLQSFIKDAINYLDRMYEPFKEYSNVTPEESLEKRKALRDYRDDVIFKKFNNISKVATYCIECMSPFLSDKQTSEIMGGFENNMGDIKKQVDRFAEIFNKVSSKEFDDIAVAAIDSIKKQAVQLDQLIYDRIFDHIDTNILAENWMTTKHEPRKLLVQRLWEERQEKLEGK